jgi:hypothetical protein
MFNLWPKNEVKEIIDNMPKFAWRNGPSFYIDEKEYTVGELVDYIKNLLKENKDLNDILKSIEEDGTEEHNTAIKLREQNAQLKVEIERLQKFENWHQPQLCSEQISELNKEVLGLRHLKKENVELIERLNKDSMTKRYQILEHNYQGCTKYRDEFKHQLDAANKEIEILKRWKKEQLIVQSWWDEVDAYVRDHDDAPLGGIVANTCLNFLKERDEYKAEVEKLKKDIVDYILEKDDKIDKLQKELNHMKAVAEGAINLCDLSGEKKTEKYYVCNHCGYKVAHDTSYWGGCGFCKDGLMIEKEEVVQKHPMYPIHWGGGTNTFEEKHAKTTWCTTKVAARDMAEEAVEALKNMKTQGFEDYDPSDFEIPLKDLPKSFPNEFQDDKTTSENLEERFDEGKDVLDFFNKVKVTTTTIGEQEEKWNCPCNICKEDKTSWEEVASDLALKIVKLEKQIEELKIVNRSIPWSVMNPDGSLKAINCNISTSSHGLNIKGTI